MDSELTLVNPLPPTAYYLSAKGPEEAVIYAQASDPLYKVTSNARQLEVSDPSTPGRTVAVLHHRDLLSDTISFPHRRNKNTVMHGSARRWLKRCKPRDGIPVFTFKTEYGQYVWKVMSRTHTQVFAEYDLERPVATCYYHRSRTADKPAFVLHSAGEPLRDDIVVAYFVQRHWMKLETRTLDLLVGV